MSEIMNRQIQMASRPVGKPAPKDFCLVERKIPDVAEDHLLVRNRFLSLDPYMRGRMSAAKSYAKPVDVGEVIDRKSVV